MVEFTSILFLGIGLMGIFAGFIFLYRNWRIKKKGIHTVAKIIDYKETTQDDEIYLDLVLEFENSAGQNIQQIVDWGLKVKYKHDEIGIVYLKRKESYKIIIDSNFGIFFIPGMVILFGASFLFLAIMAMIRLTWTNYNFS